MLRRFAVCSVVVLAGCSGLRDAMSAHQDVVARVGTQELTVNQLAQLIAPVKQVPLRRDVVDRLADLWVDYQLFGQAAARGDSLMDSATMMAANWPAAMQRIADRYHEAMIVSRAKVTDRQVDSAYAAGDARWLEHILVKVPQDTTEALKQAKLRVAQGYLAQIRRGADFGKLASLKSEDQASARNGGSLGLVTRGSLVKVFEDAAWGLKPGQVSDPVESPWGWHIIYRPALAQVRDSFAVGLRGLMVARLDSAYSDSVNHAGDIKVRSSAPAAVRLAAQNLRDAKTSGRVLATFKGGRMTLRDFARWLQAFPPQTRAAVGQAADSTLVQFVRSVVRNQMMIASAEEHHITLTPADRDTIRELYGQDLEQMRERLGVNAESLGTDSAGRRAEVAAHRVDDYFAGIVASPATHPFFEIPAFLSDVLRSRTPWSISPAGVDRALAKATDLRGPTAPGGFSPMTPAPGGPPVGGAQPGTNPPVKRSIQ